MLVQPSEGETETESVKEDPEIKDGDGTTVAGCAVVVMTSLPRTTRGFISGGFVEFTEVTAAVVLTARVLLGSKTLAEVKSPL